MEKHPACAAARSSSGLVVPGFLSALAAQVSGSSGNTSLAGRTLPFPDRRSPSHTAEARLLATEMSAVA
ncbi:MAG: hypothetical protein QW815_09415 [Nitrososphaerota archaeon]